MVIIQQQHCSKFITFPVKFTKKKKKERKKKETKDTEEKNVVHDILKGWCQIVIKFESICSNIQVKHFAELKSIFSSHMIDHFFLFLSCQTVVFGISYLS